MCKKRKPSNSHWGFNGAGAVYDKEALRESLKKRLCDNPESTRGRPSLEQMGLEPSVGHPVSFGGRHRISILKI